MLRPLVLAAVILAPAALAQEEAPFSMEVAQTEKWAKPQTPVVFPVVLANRATRPIEVSFEVAGSEGGLLTPTPQPVTLQAAGQPIDRLDVPLVVLTPYRNGYLDETGSVTYRIQATDAGTGAPIAKPQELHVVVHTRGFYAPGPQLFGAMLALAVAALLLQRK